MAARRPSKELRELLAECDPVIAKLARGLRTLVLREAPAAHETVYDAGYAISVFFSFTERWQDAFCAVGVYSRHVNLGFPQGAELPDADRQLRGAGKRWRHLQVRTPDDLRQPHLGEFLRLAMQRSARVS